MGVEPQRLTSETVDRCIGSMSWEVRKAYLENSDMYLNKLTWRRDQGLDTAKGSAMVNVY